MFTSFKKNILNNPYLKIFYVPLIETIKKEYENPAKDFQQDNQTKNFYNKIYEQKNIESQYGFVYIENGTRMKRIHKFSTIDKPRILFTDVKFPPLSHTLGFMIFLGKSISNIIKFIVRKISWLSSKIIILLSSLLTSTLIVKKVSYIPVKLFRLSPKSYAAGPYILSKVVSKHLIHYTLASAIFIRIFNSFIKKINSSIGSNRSTIQKKISEFKLEEPRSIAQLSITTVIFLQEIITNSVDLILISSLLTIDELYL